MTIIVVIFLLLISIFFLNKRSSNTKQGLKFKNSIKILYRQSARWAAAALQDNSDVIALLHANYAAGYLWSIKDICSTEEFKQITGVDFLEFESKIVEVQDSVTKNFVNKFPSLIFIKDKILLSAMYSRQ